MSDSDMETEFENLGAKVERRIVALEKTIAQLESKIVTLEKKTQALR